MDRRQIAAFIAAPLLITTAALTLSTSSAALSPPVHLRGPHAASIGLPVAVLRCIAVKVDVPAVQLDPALLVSAPEVTALQQLVGTTPDSVYGPQTAAAVPATVPEQECAGEMPSGSPVVDAVTVLNGQAPDLTTARQQALAAAAAHVSVAAIQQHIASGGSIEDFLRCTRRIESDRGDAGGQGNYDQGYGAIDPSGTYRGAYQFDQNTWNGAVARAGFPKYVGTDPAQAPSNVQDAAATQLYSERGTQPWGGRC